ncbi:hypothetical protein GHT06_009738 [Daphnia sinensis]|uniref:Uncharacterized protein n=1 Tax=Daphnia sinensis TaxID=1820382 RepID=A0AAD5LPP8_9CRUS|nr:hypothetical protein GHT06_009738 [Daphnia sinensis]
MNFLVPLFPLIATALAASIPINTYNTPFWPSLTDVVPVATDEIESRNSPLLAENAAHLLLVPIIASLIKNLIIIQMVDCVFHPDDCSASIPLGGGVVKSSPEMNALTSILSKLAVDNLQQKNGIVEGLSFPPASNFALNPVNPNNRNNLVPFGVPAFWNPYVNAPLINSQKEMAKMNYPFTGGFIPYLNTNTKFTNPSLMKTVLPQVKPLIPAGETTPI